MDGKDVRGASTWTSASPLVETLDKQHGRIERRRYWVKDISAPEWDGYAALYGRRQPHPCRTRAAAGHERQDEPAARPQEALDLLLQAHSP